MANSLIIYLRAITKGECHINNIKLLGLTQYEEYINIDSIIANEEQIDAWITLKSNSSFLCPKCNLSSNFTIKNHYETTITHSNDKHRPTFLHIDKKQYVCKTCHKTFMEPIPFVYNEFPGISAPTVISILEELKNTDHSFKEIADSHFTYPKLVSSIFNSFVSFNLGIPTNAICIDEKCYVHGNTKFALVILDFHTKKLIDLCKDRKKVTVKNWLRKVRDYYIAPPSDATLDTSSGLSHGVNRAINVQYFCIDMSKYYYDAIMDIFPYAIVAIDSFHVIRNVNEALQDVRIKVMKKYYNKERCFDEHTGELLDEETSDTKQPLEYRLLKKYKTLLFLNDDLKRMPANKKKYNIMISQYADSVDVLDYILNIDEKLCRAWQLKEQYCYFNRHATYENALPWLEQIISDFAVSRINSFVKLSKTLDSWKYQIVNSFIKVEGRRLSNGPIEGMNHNIQKLIVSGNGIPNFDTLRNRALLRYGVHNSYRLEPIKKKK